MKKIIFTLFFFLFWSTNVLSAPVIHKQTVTYDNGKLIAGVAFSNDGKKGRVGLDCHKNTKQIKEML